MNYTINKSNQVMVCDYNPLIKNNLININTTLLIVVLFAISQHVNAQKKNIFGAMIGTNISSVSDYEGKSSIGLTGGLYWEWKFADQFSIQSNIIYSQRGEKEDGAIPELKLHYLNMPLTLKYYVTKEFHVMTGVFWDSFLGVSSTIYSKDDFKKSDVGIPISISYDISNNFQLGLSYNIGLMNISKVNTNNFKPKNNWGNITIAYIFR